MYSAYLRVYEPLAAFNQAERARWESYAAQVDRPPVAAAVRLEHQRALAALLAPVAVDDCRRGRRADRGDDGDGAFVRVLDGLTYVCPWRTTLRTWSALTALRGELPDEVADAFVPAPAVAAARREYDAYRGAHPDARTHIRSATWQVPIPWFVLVESGERALRLGPRLAAPTTDSGADRDAARSVVYVAAMSRARRRAARALAVLRRVVTEGTVVDEVEELARWLEDFHPHAVVELDYGALVHLLDDDALREDDSAGDVAAALAGLAVGDLPAAATAYEQVMARWQAVRSVELAN